ncbi:MAG: hypothetical protein GHCLOJNM_00253 [bacterium]|nr:hypothetical protein [bacterium]
MSARLPLRTATWVAAFLLSAPTYSQVSVVTLQQGSNGYTGSDDAGLYEEEPNFSNGGFPEFHVGRTGDNAPAPPTGALRRAAIRFDLTGIPAGAIVLDVTLRLTVSGSPPTGPDDVPASLHPILKDWGEGSVSGGNRGAAAAPGDATWTSNKHGQETWTAPGGDFGAASATTLVGRSGSPRWSSAAMGADVQGWLDNSATNFGWMVVGDESGTLRTARTFTSSEGGASARPVLEVKVQESVSSVEHWFLY